MSLANDKKILGFFDIALMTITANFGIRYLSVSGAIGPSSLILWIIIAILFFIPVSVICMQMAIVYPEEGGLYAWVRHTLGEKNGFIVAWVYWVNNIFFCPAVLIFCVSNFAYSIGHPELMHNKLYTVFAVIAVLWIIIIISSLGLRVSKSLVNLGGIFGLLIPIVFLVVFSILAFIKFGGSATKYNLHTLAPNSAITNNLFALSVLMLGMAGVDVIPTFANSVKNIKRDLCYGILVGSLIIIALYIGGTFAINVLITPEEVVKSFGLIEFFTTVGTKFNIPWVTHIIAFLLCFADIASMTVWLLASVTIFFKCTPRGILPDIMHKTDKNGTPINAIICQGILVSTIILLSGILPSIDLIYQELFLMATVLSFVPYLFLAVAYLRTAKKLNASILNIRILAFCLFISVFFGILISFVPSTDLKGVHDIMLYEIQICSGPIVFIGLGYLIYKFRRIAK
ncbi:MAG: amino acid transporter [Burkholderiales bacterium]|jgi:amino acid transporter|nr:amino acid transporter [Burkholderiales bacterium]